MGATGFIGSQLVRELSARGHRVTAVTAPRVRSPRPERPHDLLAEARHHEDLIAALATQFHGSETVVNAAGLATPAAPESAELTGANALMPVIVALAAARAGVLRTVHLSSAASQGRRKVLDESAETQPFSPYSRSKAEGEHALLALCDELDEAAPEIVIVRATSVHGAGTGKVDSLRRMARSRSAVVAGAGDASTVLSSVDDFVRFVHWVGSWPSDVPTIVLQPNEGLTTADVLRLAGDAEPRHRPAWLCRLALGVGYAAAVLAPEARARLRRVELRWFGQRMAPTWADAHGWQPSDALARMLTEPPADSLS